MQDEGSVCQAADAPIDDRAIGPVVIKAIVGALAATLTIPWERRLTRAVISYIFSQLEGVPKRIRIVSDIAAVEYVDHVLLDQPA